MSYRGMGSSDAQHQLNSRQRREIDRIGQKYHFNLAPPPSSLDEITASPKFVSLTKFIEQFDCKYAEDAQFQTTARSKGISVVRLTQNLPNFLDAYGSDGKHKVDTLLGNHATKIFHRNGDPTTNEWASKIIAKETTYRHSISANGSSGNSQTSVTEVEEDSCPPKEFVGLKNGGRKHDCIVEGVLFQSGRLWLKDQR